MIIISSIVWLIHHRMTYVEYKLYGVVINSEQVDYSLESTMKELLEMEKHEGVSIIAGLFGETVEEGVAGDKN